VSADYSDVLEEYRIAVGNARRLPKDVAHELTGEAGGAAGRRAVRGCRHCVPRHSIRERVRGKGRRLAAAVAYNESLSRLGINARMADVVGWLEEPSIRDSIRDRVAAYLTADVTPAVVIDHSLGSLVTLDLLAHTANSTATLNHLRVTLGSSDDRHAARP
jgi:hypothetical protein